MKPSNPKQLKVKIPKGYAPFGKMEVIREKENLYLVVDLISANFQELLKIILEDENKTIKSGKSEA